MEEKAQCPQERKAHQGNKKRRRKCDGKKCMNGGRLEKTEGKTAIDNRTSEEKSCRKRSNDDTSRRANEEKKMNDIWRST